MSWNRVPLGKIAIEDRKIVTPDATEVHNSLPYLGLEQIAPNTGEILSYDGNSAEGKSTTFAFDERHVLYGKLRPYLNKVATPIRKGRCSTEIIPLLPQGVDREFLSFLLRTSYVIDAVMSEKTGSRMPRADMQALLKIHVAIPDTIEEQRQIAARLKAQLAEVDKARQAAEAQLRDVSLLVIRFQEEALKQYIDIQRIPLGELLHGIEAGKSFQTTERIAKPHELGVLKVSAVSWNKFLPQEAKAIEGKYQPDEKHRVTKGDLIISRANTLELVGAVVRVAEDYPTRLLSDKTLRLVVKEEMILPDYLLTILKLPEARLHIETNATGTSNSMRNISQKTINTIPVPLLPLDKQQELIDRFSQFNQEVLLLQSTGNSITKDINLLPQKLLAQAFESAQP